MNLRLRPGEIAMIRSVFRNHPEVSSVVLFGSRAKGTQTARSDVDLAIYGTVTPLKAQRILAELDELPLPYKFDAQVFEHLQNTALREHIDRVGIQLYPGIGSELKPSEGVSTEDIERRFRELSDGSEDVWRTLHEASSDELRAYVVLALQEANGSYKKAARLFHVPDKDYRRFLDLLRSRGCIIDSTTFRRMALGI